MLKRIKSKNIIENKKNHSADSWAVKSQPSLTDFE